ncbi:MAG: helicase RepA family protein [Leptospirales bacterium]
MNLPNPISFLHASTTEPPKLDFILPGFIPGTVAGLVSPGGTGKSFFALELACAVAGGGDANLLKLPVTGQGPVLYLAAEDPPEILHKRLHHIARYMPEPVIEVVNENLFVIPALASGVNVLEPEWSAEIAGRATGCRLIVLDTLSRLHAMDENRTGEAKSVMRQLEFLAKTVGAGLLYLHHISKHAAVNGAGDTQQAARGSSAFVDDARYCSFLKGMTEEEAKKIGIDPDQRAFYVRWNANKQNYALPESDRWFVRADGGVLIPATFQERKKEGTTRKMSEGADFPKEKERVKKENTLLLLAKEAEHVWV